jgi:adenylate cyclase
VAAMRSVARRTWVQVAVANVAGATLAAASGALTGEDIKGQPAFDLFDAITLCVYLGLTLPLGHWWGERRFKAAIAWLSEDRAPTLAEQRRTLSLPLYFAVLSMVGWLGAVVLWTLLTGVGHTFGYTVRVAVSIALGGLTTSALTYLLSESTHRPLVALALATHVPDRGLVPGVRTKLIASWAVGADVFLLMIGLTFLGRSARQPPSATAIWFIVGAGLVAGTLVVFVAARSLADPLREMRTAVSRVQQGHLDVTVAVNDGGEVGMLQAGFNQMVAGLRERNALQDLFGRHVGEDVARQALRQGVVLGGERREVGVLFVDILGSTALSQTHSPDRVVDLLNQFFAAIIKVVAAEGGWVNKFEGDGALCVFGAPNSLDDYAVRALRAARTIRREVLALAAVHPELDAAVGVSAGPVVAGNIGAEQRYEYTVIGTPVNEAARLTDEAKHRLSRVLASEDAVARAGGEASSWMVADELKLRGIGEPVLVYEPASGVREHQVSS